MNQKTTKKQKSKPKTKPTTTKKPNNKVPTQKENTSLLGKSNTNYIRNMLINNISGTQNTTSENLAIYMAKHKYSNVRTATNKLLGYNTLSLKCSTVTVHASSIENSDIEKAANDAVSRLKGKYKSYGIGINTTFKGNKFNIYIVIVSQ